MDGGDGDGGTSATPEREANESTQSTNMPHSLSTESGGGGAPHHDRRVSCRATPASQSRGPVECPESSPAGLAASSQQPAAQQSHRTSEHRPPPPPPPLTGARDRSQQRAACRARAPIGRGATSPPHPQKWAALLAPPRTSRARTRSYALYKSRLSRFPPHTTPTTVLSRICDPILTMAANVTAAAPSICAP